MNCRPYTDAITVLKRIIGEVGLLLYEIFHSFVTFANSKLNNGSKIINKSAVTEVAESFVMLVIDHYYMPEVAVICKVLLKLIVCWSGR